MLYIICSKNTVLALETCVFQEPLVQKEVKKMNKYELMFIIAGDASEEKREELIAKQKAYVESHNGTVEGVDKIGMKKLAYPINFKNEGFYVLMNIQMNPAEVDAMSKLINITDGIVRHIFVRK
jgi:small subunit ribosomal protein S6